jgi:hypothetical protein
MPEVRYIRYMEISEIKQQMRKDLADNKLSPLQKSLFDARPPEFLYDIENDLWETKNLAGEPAYKPVLEKMRRRLKNEILQSRDVMFLPEYEIGLVSKTTTPYEYRMNSKVYPLDEIYKAASLSGFRGREITGEQVKLLDSPDKIVRYWAVTGLRSQKSADLNHFAQPIMQAMNDPYPPVAVTAAAIAYQESGNQLAMENLKKFCAGENMDIALMAINFLLYADNKQPFIETIQSVRKMEGRSYSVKAACMDFLGSLGLVPNNPDYRE